MVSLSVGQLARICAGTITGDSERNITGANVLEAATADDLCFVVNERAGVVAGTSNAGCLIVPLAFNREGAWSVIRVNEPRQAFAQCVAALYKTELEPATIHPSAIIHPTAMLGDGCRIGPYVTVGADTSIGNNCSLAKGCTIGSGCRIGEGATLHPNVTIYDRVTIGVRVVLHSGCVLGADGFGFTLAGDHYEKFPQVGTVEIGDDVEVGANSCIDRAALGKTIIGSGTKLDNLVHVAHNCVIGRHVVAAAQVGLSGGVTVGDYAVLGGQAGIADKAQIEARAVVGAKSGIVSSQRVPAGEPVWGMPGRPLRQHLRNLAYVAKLGEMRSELRSLQRKVAQLADSADV